MYECRLFVLHVNVYFIPTVYIVMHKIVMTLNLATNKLYMDVIYNVHVGLDSITVCCEGRSHI